MKVCTSTDEITNLNIFAQLEHPLALTAPFIAEDQVIVGMYSAMMEFACIHVDIDTFINIKHFLYDPKWFRLMSHGIKRIWEEHEIGSLDTHTHLIADTEIMSYLLDSGRDEHQYSVSYLARRYLDINYPNRSDDICDQGYPEALYQILSEDAYLIWELAAELLGKMDASLRWFYFHGELKIALILNEMTRYGIPVDGRAAATVYRDALAQMKKLEAEITSGAQANLWDGSAVYRVLRDQKAVFTSQAVLRRQEVTQKELKQMASSNPIAAKILDWRNSQTDLSFLEAAAGKSRIHPKWNMMTKTSRITASHPAVQNANKVTCRPLMRPSSGWTMIKADYKQVQMRILANLSNDPELIAAFREGKDVHQLTVEMCGIHGPTDKERRDKAKAVNYGILFQMTADSLSRELGTDLKTAQGYIKAFWAKYAVARKWLDDFVSDLKKKDPEERVVSSPLGRTRRFEGEFGLPGRRGAKATLLQQLEADLLRMAVMRLYACFRDLGMQSRVVMVIHDAVYVETPEEEAQQAQRLIKAVMEDAVEMPIVPLAVDIEFGSPALSPT